MSRDDEDDDIDVDEWLESLAERLGVSKGEAAEEVEFVLVCLLGEDDEDPIEGEGEGQA